MPTENTEQMTLRKYVENRRKDYEGKPEWRWTNEGVVYAIFDYVASYEVTDEDRAYAREIKEDDTLAVALQPNDLPED